MELAAAAFEPPAASRRGPASRRDLAGPEEVLDRHDNLTVARAIYRGRVEQYPPPRGVALRPRARAGAERSAGHLRPTLASIVRDAIGTVALLAARLADKIDPMMRYTPKTVGDLLLVLSGLDSNMPVEVEPDIPLAAKTVADLRALTAWPRGLVLIVPRDRGHPESVVKVERREPR